MLVRRPVEQNNGARGWTVWPAKKDGSRSKRASYVLAVNARQAVAVCVPDRLRNAKEETTLTYFTQSRGSEGVTRWRVVCGNGFVSADIEVFGSSFLEEKKRLSRRG